jgi:acyl carrier protein
MNGMSAEEVKTFVLTRLQATHPVTSLADDLDLLECGYLDSLGIIELIGAVERQFGVVIDFGGLEADELTIIGPFCRYVARISPSCSSEPSPECR